MQWKLSSGVSCHYSLRNNPEERRSSMLNTLSHVYGANMAVFCSCLLSCFTVMLLRCFLNDMEMVPVVSIITGITFVFTFLVRPVSIVRPLRFGIFSNSLLFTFLSPEVVATDKQVHSSLSRFMSSELLLGMVLLVCAY